MVDEELLATLRKDLQLDPATDLLPGTPAALLHLGIDRGQGTVTFTASTVSALVTVQHRLGTKPTAIVAMDIDGGGIYFNASNLTPTTFQLRGDYVTTLTGTFTFCWIATI